MAKTIVITGAGTGIGADAARGFLGDGWNVALLGRRAELLEDVADSHSNALTCPCDISDETAVDAAFATIAARFGRIDVLFNNAGAGLPGTTIDQVSVADWRRIVDVNLTGTFLCARAAFRHMRGQSPQGGRIINNGSVSAYVPRPGSVAYTSTKHAVTGLTKTLALDGRPFGVACGQIDIGNALTDMVQPMTEGVPQADGSVQAEATMDVARVTDALRHMASLPLDANVLFMTVMATKMPYVGRG
ncbi:MAG: SDR family oxidoreductase [Pseudomonadota bacterium]